MPKAIRVKDTVTGTESWEELDDFQRKPGGRMQHEVSLAALRGALGAARDIVELRTAILNILTHIEKS